MSRTKWLFLCAFIALAPQLRNDSAWIVWGVCIAGAIFFAWWDNRADQPQGRIKGVNPPPTHARPPAPPPPPWPRQPECNGCPGPGKSRCCGLAQPVNPPIPTNPQPIEQISWRHY